jgi:hypothetical protein
MLCADVVRAFLQKQFTQNLSGFVRGWDKVQTDSLSLVLTCAVLCCAVLVCLCALQKKLDSDQVLAGIAAAGLTHDIGQDLAEALW